MLIGGSAHHTDQVLPLTRCVVADRARWILTSLYVHTPCMYLVVGSPASVGQQVMCLQYLGLHLNEEDYEKEYNKADAVGVAVCCAWVTTVPATDAACRTGLARCRTMSFAMRG